MYALLGNTTGIVKVPGMDGYVFFRASFYSHPSYPPHTEVGIALNENAIPPVYDLPVRIFDGKVVEVILPKELR